MKMKDTNVKDTDTYSKTGKMLLKISAVLWFLWGLVHIAAGVFTTSFILGDDTAAAVSGIADKVDEATVAIAYPDAVSAIIGQHGFNLLWIGIVTAIAAVFIWKRQKNAIFFAALVGGLADIGYFLFLDLGGFVKFMPGTFMTIVSSLAVITSFFAYFKYRNIKV